MSACRSVYCTSNVSCLHACNLPRVVSAGVFMLARFFLVVILLSYYSIHVTKGSHGIIECIDTRWVCLDDTKGGRRDALVILLHPRHGGITWYHRIYIDTQWVCLDDTLGGRVCVSPYC